MKTTGRMMLALLIALVLTANMVSVTGFAVDKDIKSNLQLTDGTESLSLSEIVGLESTAGKRGDANLNGDVEITDVTTIQRYAAAMIDLSDEAKQLADVDQDGHVCVIDATCIQCNLAGLPSPIDSKPSVDNALYAAAVRDAMVVSEDEIMPLVNITKDDENVIWDGDKVLVLFMHKYPDSYPAGEEIKLKWGDVWCVSAVEAVRWVQHNQITDDPTKRLHQLLGMPLSKGYTTITALWVDASLLYRPAFVTDPTAPMKTTYQPTGDPAFDEKYLKWFDSNVRWSYIESAYPWTRLGYTYDWADNGTAYGLSEFIIFSGAPAKVAYTFTVDEFVAYATAQ